MGCYFYSTFINIDMYNSKNLIQTKKNLNGKAKKIEKKEKLQ